MRQYADIKTRQLDRTFFFILVRTKGHSLPSVTFSTELDEPTSREYALTAIKEMDPDKFEVVTVSAFNTVEGWSRDVSEDLAREWLAELVRDGHDFSESMPAFIEQNISISEAEALRAEHETRERRVKPRLVAVGARL